MRWFRQDKRHIVSALKDHWVHYFNVITRDLNLELIWGVEDDCGERCFMVEGGGAFDINELVWWKELKLPKDVEGCI